MSKTRVSLLFDLKNPWEVKVYDYLKRAEGSKSTNIMRILYAYVDGIELPKQELKAIKEEIATTIAEPVEELSSEDIDLSCGMGF